MKYGEYVHDCQINSYEVNIKEETLVLHTTYDGFRGHKNILISFIDVLSHHFEDIILQNVISDIYETMIVDFIEEYKEMIQEGKGYSWPTDYDNQEDLINYLKSNSYKIFYLDSAVGLYGFIIAKDIRIDIQP